VEIGTFVGTFGIFLSLFLLFMRYLPMVAMSEIKIVLPESDAHYVAPGAEGTHDTAHGEEHK
jgi:molybdopterin-containing oxidoreductase family membrane subunit